MLIIIATVVSIAIGAIGLIATVGHGVKWIFRRGEVSGRAEVEHEVEVRTVADRLSDLEVRRSVTCRPARCRGTLAPVVC